VTAGFSARAVPFYCPYCGEEDLRPYGEANGEFACASCLRVFRLSLTGVGARPTA
jgi:transposase-like protein